MLVLQHFSRPLSDFCCFKNILLIHTVSPHLNRHMKTSPNVSNSPIDFMSSTLGSDLGTTLLSEDEEEEEEEDERYAVVSKNLCGFEYTPGHSMDNLEGSGKNVLKINCCLHF